MPLPRDAAPDALPALARGNGDLAAYRGRAAGCGPTGSRRPWPSVPRSRGGCKKTTEGRSGGGVWNLSAASPHFYVPWERRGRSGDTVPPRPPRVPANVQPPLFASRPRRSHRPGPPLLCPRQHRARTEPGAGAALPPPAGARGIWCPSFQQAARQIVKLPEPSEQSGPGTDGRDCGCLRHNLGAAVSAFPQSIHAMCNGTRPCGPG